LAGWIAGLLQIFPSVSVLIQFLFMIALLVKAMKINANGEGKKATVNER